MEELIENNNIIQNEFLTFILKNQEYGIDILKIQEIISIVDITPIPKLPDFIRGVINLRGKIIPVMDLRLKFGLEFTDYTDQSSIIVVQTNNLKIGLIVDRVSEVIEIKDEEIEPVPYFGIEVDTDYIIGLGKIKEKVIILLDIDKVLSTQEILYISSFPTFKNDEFNLNTDDFNLENI